MYKRSWVAIGVWLVITCTLAALDLNLLYVTFVSVVVALVAFAVSRPFSGWPRVIAFLGAIALAVFLPWVYYWMKWNPEGTFGDDGWGRTLSPYLSDQIAEHDVPCNGRTVILRTAISALLVSTTQHFVLLQDQTGSATLVFRYRSTEGEFADPSVICDSRVIRIVVKNQSPIMITAQLHRFHGIAIAYSIGPYKRNLWFWQRSFW